LRDDAYAAWHARPSTASRPGAPAGVAASGVSIGGCSSAVDVRAPTDASKIALPPRSSRSAAPTRRTIDCQRRQHLASLGGREIARGEFQRRLRSALATSDVADWSYDLRLWEELGLGAPAGGGETAAPEDSQ
jgi:hypothetical protein